MSSEDVSAERAQTVLNDLIRQRQKMRATGAEQGLLEANRLGIIYWQRLLAQARRNGNVAA